MKKLIVLLLIAAWCRLEAQNSTLTPQSKAQENQKEVRKEPEARIVVPEVKIPDKLNIFLPPEYFKKPERAISSAKRDICG